MIHWERVVKRRKKGVLRMKKREKRGGRTAEMVKGRRVARE
jgi:hypothetical protein